MSIKFSKFSNTAFVLNNKIGLRIVPEADTLQPRLKRSPGGLSEAWDF